ncbi:2'-N-acetylparomamine deacetylase [compost metagenome]
MTTICLSPHLDDAVLSLGATLAETRLAGGSVLVLNLFSASTENFRSGPLSFRARALAPERQAEEANAMAHLGVEHQNLGLLDAPFRDRRYRAYARLLGPVPSWEQCDQEALERVRAIAQERGATRILAPLGVGGHVDHRLTYRVGKALEAEFEVGYYEDLPYALVPFALSRRLRELGVPLPGRTPSVAEVVRAVRAYYARHPVYLARPAWQRRLASLGIGAWTAQTERRARKGSSKPLTLAPEVMTVSSEAFARKLLAIAAYESQVPTMFASMPAAEEALRSYAAGVMTSPSPYAERLWRPEIRDCADSPERS